MIHCTNSLIFNYIELNQKYLNNNNKKKKKDYKYEYDYKLKL